MRRIVWLTGMACGVCLLSPGAYGWGPATHLYVASRIVGTNMLDTLYGAMAPDMCALEMNPAIKSPFQHMTHFEYDRLAPGFFSFGFATHNGTWGADHYVHTYWDPVPEETYLILIMRQLCQEFGFTMSDAESLMEGTVEYMLRKDLGPGLGTLVTSSANAFGEAQTQQLVDGFAEPLSQRVAGLTPAQAETEIRNMANGFQTVMSAYGQQLAGWDDAALRAFLITGIAAALSTDEVTADLYVTRAEELAWDYQDELDVMAGRVAARIAATEYRLPLSFNGLVVEAVVIGIAFLTLRRRWLRI